MPDKKAKISPSVVLWSLPNLGKYYHLIFSVTYWLFSSNIVDYNYDSQGSECYEEGNNFRLLLYFCNIHHLYWVKPETYTHVYRSLVKLKVSNL